MTAQSIPADHGRARAVDVIGSLATLLSLVVLVVLYSGAAYFRQSATEINLGRVVTNPVHPRYLYLAILIFTLFAVFQPNGALRRKKIPGQFLWACAIFAIFMTAQVFMQAQSDFFWFSYHLEFMVMIPCYIVLLGSASNPELIFKVLRWIVVFESLFYGFLFVEPRAFPLFTPYFGRVSGMWGNPNVAAIFIAASVPLIAIGLKPSRRAFVYMITLLGVLATLSRGGLVIWTVMFILSLFFRSRTATAADRAERTLYLAGGGLAALVGTVLANINVMGWLASVSTGKVTRLSTTRDFSTSERLYVLKLGWSKFMENPIFGNGVGYTMRWDYASASTHNMFLLVLAEQGAIGFLILMFWILSFLSFPGVSGIWAIGFFCSSGIFSHNMFEGEYAIIFALYFLGAYAEKDLEARQALAAA